MGTRLLIATPYDGGDLWTARVTLGYHNFVRALEKQLGSDVLDGSMLFACDVVRARNRAAAMVLRDFPAHTHVLWLDDDNFPEHIDDGVRVVREMLAADEDIVAAPYTNKKHPTRWVHQAFHGEQPDPRGLVRVRSVGFGFTLTSVACLREMSEKASHYWDLPNEHRIANIFGQINDEAPDGRPFLASEDFSFCARWRAMAGDVYVYAKAGVILHAGSRAYSARDMPGIVT